MYRMFFAWVSPVRTKIRAKVENTDSLNQKLERLQIENENLKKENRYLKSIVESARLFAFTEPAGKILMHYSNKSKEIMKNCEKSGSSAATCYIKVFSIFQYVRPANPTFLSQKQGINRGYRISRKIYWSALFMPKIIRHLQSPLQAACQFWISVD
jgi:regulator of replication initiation timing